MGVQTSARKPMRVEAQFTPDPRSAMTDVLGRRARTERAIHLIREQRESGEYSAGERDTAVPSTHAAPNSERNTELAARTLAA
jgi:hypothetical protein